MHRVITSLRWFVGSLLLLSSLILLRSLVGWWLSLIVGSWLCPHLFLDSLAHGSMTVCTHLQGVTSGTHHKISYLANLHEANDDGEDVHLDVLPGCQNLGDQTFGQAFAQTFEHIFAQGIHPDRETFGQDFRQKVCWAGHSGIKVFVWVGLWLRPHSLLGAS